MNQNEEKTLYVFQLSSFFARRREGLTHLWKVKVSWKSLLSKENVSFVCRRNYKCWGLGEEFVTEFVRMFLVGIVLSQISKEIQYSQMSLLPTKKWSTFLALSRGQFSL